MSPLTQLAEQLEAKRGQIRSIFEKAKAKDADGVAQLDFRLVTGISKDVDELEGTAKSVRVAEHVGELKSEVDELAGQVEKIKAAEEAADAFAKSDQNAIKRPSMPDGPAEQKTLGQMITGHPQFKKWMDGSRDGKIVLPIGLKALFQTTAGWLPESTRTGRVTEAVTRPVQLLDILPVAQTGQPSVLWMLETTRTHAAAEVGEGLQKPEAEFVLTEQTSPVQEIATSIPVTETQLEDVPAVESYLESRLRFGIEQRLDGQVMDGDGIAPNLLGILNTAGIQTQPTGADPVPDAIFKAMTLVRVGGRAVPTHVVLHPNDWQEIRLLRTADGIYIWGSPSETGAARIWGLPVVLNEIIPENTGLVGSFEMAWITLYERRGIVVEQGFVGDQFRENRRTIRASGRWAIIVPRPAAFATVTGI